ncbi:Transporter [Strongyloides ratti]|uniref:Transporter n=1 Tax=Strongyloides ratti TaxID=34506 RepID=A0A090LEB5_STRRB|nr:Transporter [Strongyloides ratti]CEF65845.1 Transporter [Strongyloides ratti]
MLRWVSIKRSRKTQSSGTSSDYQNSSKSKRKNKTPKFVTDMSLTVDGSCINNSARSEGYQSLDEKLSNEDGSIRTTKHDTTSVYSTNNNSLKPPQSSITGGSRRHSLLLPREQWNNKMEFLLAVIGYAVDLGNIWRFPSICYKYGGGAFLIPYLIMLLVGGLPMFYLELLLGQYHRSGCISIWKGLCPLFKGIGYGICIISTIMACFYNAIIAQAVYFTFASITSLEVPWKRCGNSWNTPLCRDDTMTIDSINKNITTFHRTASQEYYIYNVLESHKSSGFDDLNGIKIELAGCLAVVFFTVYFALWKGPKSSGKFVWITATAPYIVLFILLIRGITLPGASKGIKYYLTPNFTTLQDPEVWTAAATQIFFSLGPGFGVLLALSSYNDFHNNCYRDAIVTSIINCLTSFFSGFVIFSTLGYMSEITNTPVSEVVGAGESSLIFIVYPQALATMSYSNLWSFIFFVMLITLGIDSTFAGIEAFITGFCDEFPHFIGRRRELFVGVVIFLFFIGSLPTVTYGGSFVIPFLDGYGVSLSVLFIVMMEMIVVCWFYGINKFSENVREMLGFYPGRYWRTCWICCPVFIGIIFSLAVYNTNFKPMVDGDYTYPQWSVYLGWGIRMLSVLAIPVYGLILIIKTPGALSKRLRLALTPQKRRDSRRLSVCNSNVTRQSIIQLNGNTVITTAPKTSIDNEKFNKIFL